MALRFAKLTRAACRGLQPSESITEHGISVKRLKSGDLVYSIASMVDRQRVHRVIGRESDGITRQQAEDALEALRTRAREDRLNLPAGRKAYPLFREAAPNYLKRLEQSDGKNLAIKRRHIENNLIPAFGSERLDKLTEFGLRKYRKKRLSDGVGDATINREMATLSHFLRSAVTWKWMKVDALPTIPKVAEPRKSINVLTDAEARALMKAAIADQDQRLWLFIKVGLNSAMRHREILRIRYDQIDFAARRIFVPQAKAGAREQPITRALADALKRQRAMEVDPDGYVFPTLNAKQANGGHRTNMARPFERAVIRAGLDPKKVSPHTMRHTAITRLVKAGVDLPTIQRISGHKTLAMVLRYAHVHGAHIDKAISALSAPLTNTVTQKLPTPPQRVVANNRLKRGKQPAKTAA